MSTFLPPPISEPVMITDRLSGQQVMSPIWSNWFLKLAQGMTSTGGGSGNVVGPSSSTNHAIVLWDGTTGKLLKNMTGLGTSTDILYGNAAGIPSWQSPSLQRSFLLGGM